MTDRETLIEETRSAILDHFHSPDDRHASWWINPEEMARAALAVFEKALGEATVTPTVAEGTSDEREA